jgi:hypothetical protein
VPRKQAMAIDSIVVFEFDDIHPEELFQPGHAVFDWCFEIKEMLENFSKAEAPPRTSRSRWGHVGTGFLAANIHADMTRTGPESYDMILNSDAEYSKYVHGGTAGGGTGFIYSSAGWRNRAMVDEMVDARIFFPRGARGGLNPALRAKGIRSLFMTLPPNTGGRFRFHLRVRGQRANPFLVKGYNRTRLLHDGLPPLGSLLEPITGVLGNPKRLGG